MGIEICQTCRGVCQNMLTSDKVVHVGARKSGLFDIVFQRFFRAISRNRRQNSPKVEASERVYAIGDIHGRDDLLKSLLNRIRKDAARFSDDRQTRFIFLGDYVDRGDRSAEVLDILCDMQKSADVSCDFLMGNHEAAFLNFLDDPDGGANWIRWGGQQTMASYGLETASDKPGAEELVSMSNTLSIRAARHLPFLRALKRYVVSGDVVFAHASLDPALKLEDQPDEALLWGRVPSALKSGLPGHRLVHGHFANDTPVLRPERICVDTGAYFTGRLTAVRLDETADFLHVDEQDPEP